MHSPRVGALSPSNARTPTRAQSGTLKPDALQEEYLFTAPSELVCPLTLAPFIDPVLTTAGHVYERAAIQNHLERSTTDPLSRQPLLNKSLTPVYVLRSRALEYRESVARACIARVCAGAAEPVRYLRRAVELIADTGSHVQGLSKETVEYVQNHPSNAFDRIALQLFAQGLFQSGYRDRAATIWSSLLLQDSDRVQQAELLRRCLSCWTDEPNSALGGGDDYVFQKLVGVFDRRSMGWDQLVELAQEAHLGDQFVLRLCEQLLFRPMPPPGSGSPRGSEALASVSFQEKRLLLKYVHTLTDSLQRRQSEVERRLQELERWRRRRSSGSKSSGSLSEDGGSPRGARGFGPRMPGWVRHPVLVVTFMFLTAALPPGHAAGRVLRAAPFLALLPTH